MYYGNVMLNFRERKFMWRILKSGGHMVYNRCEMGNYTLRVVNMEMPKLEEPKPELTRRFDEWIFSLYPTSFQPYSMKMKVYLTSIPILHPKSIPSMPLCPRFPTVAHCLKRYNFYPILSYRNH